MKNIILSGFLIITLYSCNKKPYNEFPQVIHDELRYKLNLPDTVFVNKPYTVTIEFESDFDTIMPAVQVDASDSTKVRLITYYRYEPVRAPMESLRELIRIDSTFVLNKKFKFENTIFKEKGEFIFCGFIKDVIMYNHYNERGIRDTVHFEHRKQQIFKKVVVVD